MRAIQRPRWVLLVVLVACAVACGVACGGGPGASSSGGAVSPPNTPIAETCATRLAPRTSASPPPGPGAQPFAAPRSTLVVHTEVPLAGLRQALEAKVPRRVAEQRDHDLGAAGRLEYTVDRGPFTVRVEKDALVVESILQGRAQACAKGHCYAGCAPEARVTARVPLRLSADYKLRTSEVRIDVTRGCQVRALGGLLTIDVTPILRSALAQQTRTIQASIDRELPDLGPEAARLWTELGKARALPLGACIVLSPEEITQGPATGTPEVARLRFGLLARPEVRVKCAAAGAGPVAKPLPPLRDDAALPPVGDVHLAIVLGDDAPARAMERGEPFDLGGRRARVTQVAGDARSGLVLGLGGEACGDVGISVGGVAWLDPQSLHLTGTAPMVGENERLAAAGLQGALLVTAAERAPIALPIAVSALETLLPELARGMSDEKVTIAATVESAKPESAGLRGAEVIAVALLRGAVTLRAK